MKLDRARQIAVAVLDHYLEHASPATPDDIAARLGTSAGVVRATFTRHHGLVPCVSLDRIHYYDSRGASRLRDGYIPTREYMRAQLLAARGRMP